jgi:predicted  nucleic acid-binding Zn ribbon protein
MHVIETVFQSLLFVSSLVNLYEIPKNHSHFSHQVVQLEIKYNTLNNRQANSAITIADNKKQINNLSQIASELQKRIEEDLKKINKISETGFALAYSAISANYKYKYNESYWPDTTIATLSAAILAYQFSCSKELESLLARLENLTTKIKISADMVE